MPEYIANSGSSCFYCKSQLYTTLQGVADEFIEAAGPSDSKVVMYNGTNADDRRDPTRLGLVAAVGDCIPTVFRRNHPERARDFCLQSISHLVVLRGSSPLAHIGSSGRFAYNYAIILDLAFRTTSVSLARWPS